MSPALERAILKPIRAIQMKNSLKKKFKLRDVGEIVEKLEKIKFDRLAAEKSENFNLSEKIKQTEEVLRWVLNDNTP